MWRLYVAIVLVGCGAAIPPVPSKGGPAWFELESEHFTLWTDASVARGRELIREMEHLRQVVRGMAFPDLPPQGRSFVIALRDGDEVGAYMPKEFIAFAWQGPVLRQPAIVFAADTNDDDGHVIAHELTHVISFEVIRHQPRWFAEGIARFFETVKLDADRAVVDVGEPLPGMVRDLQMLPLLPVGTLFACNDRSCLDGRFYMTAWALISFLANEHPAELARFEQLLDTSPDSAWQDAFPQVDRLSLDGAIRNWLTHGQHMVWHYKVALKDWPVLERKLTDADAYAARALLGITFDAPRARTEADAAAAVAADPTNVLARLVDHQLRHATTIDQARATAHAHSDDWRAWWLLVEVAGKNDEAVAAERKVCELAVLNPAVQSPYRCR